MVDICKEAAFYEHRIRKGQKPIFHLEAFAAKCAPQPCSRQLRGAPALLDWTAHVFGDGFVALMAMAGVVADMSMHAQWCMSMAQAY